MEKRLLLKDSKGELIAELLSFTYNAKRMGGAPTISATLHSFTELYLTTDDYVEFNGEKYFIKHTPTSSKSNTDARYKYDLEFVSERVMLDNIYFHDASWSSEDASKAIAKSSKFHFVGSVRDLADKINASLSFSNVDKYHIEVGDDILSEDSKFIQFSDMFVSNAIQEFYNTFEIPYYFYWNGSKTVVRVTFGSAQHPTEPFEYGKDNALLSISKANANYKIINKCTGVGSSENLPYYYPNESSTGEHTFLAYEGFGDVRIDYDKLDKHTNLRDGATLTYHTKPQVGDQFFSYKLDYFCLTAPTGTTSTRVTKENITSLNETLEFRLSDDKTSYISDVEFVVTAFKGQEIGVFVQYGFQVTASLTENIIPISGDIVKCAIVNLDNKWNSNVGIVQHEYPKYTFENNKVSFTTENDGRTHIKYRFSVDKEKVFEPDFSKQKIGLNASVTFLDDRAQYEEDYFTVDDSDKTIYISKSGVYLDNAVDGGVIVVSETQNWVEPQQNLMPTIYRETNGLERYYIASNEDVIVDGYQYGYGGHEFTNPFVNGRPKEHIINVEDLKPTIKGVIVGEGESAHRIDKFVAFEYDEHDNDEVDENNNYKHPYFYAKLSKLDFNLFEHASEQGDMTISFTSGKSASCKFVVMVDSDSQKNIIQVDNKGNLLRDENGDVKRGAPQGSQQDTINNEVWIALKKEDSTMGYLMPNVKENIKPSVDDTFVITNISLPNSYITYAEKLLEDKIKEYLISNNDDKFNFSIKFSRIFLAEHEDIRSQITENASLNVIYQGKEATLYVSSYTYKMTQGEALPEITVELSDTLATQRGVMQNVINQVKMDVMTSVAQVDIVAQAASSFLRKDQNDKTVHKITAQEIDVRGGANFDDKVSIAGDVHSDGGLSIGRKATFKDSIETIGDITVGNFNELLGEIRGAKVAQDGSAVFKSIRANYLEVMSLIYNQIKASSAYTVFDDTATVVDFTLEGNVYTLTFDDTEFSVKADNGIGVQPFDTDDILVAYVNKINNYEYSQSGECWLRVTDIPSATNGLLPNQVRAIMYTDNEVPTAPNIAPNKNMVLAHKGNANDEKPERQSTIYVSSKDGNIVQLLGVNKPKLLNIDEGYSNYGAVIGKLPQDLFDHIYETYPTIKKELPYVYAKGLIVQDLMQLDYSGRLMQGENYRGHWSLETAKNEPYMNSESSYDTVTHNGSLWKCMESYTTVEPSKNTTTWLVKVSAGEIPPMYRLKPSTNVIHYRPSTNTFEPDNFLSVAVGETIESGYAEITSQAILNELGLSVYYAIDGDKENKKFLNISPAAAIELEDGSGILAAQDGSGLFLEGEEIDVATIEKNITLYLVRTSDDEVIDEFAIVVSEDGRKGDKGADGAGYSLFIDTPIISQPISASSKKTIGSQDFKVNVTLNNNGEYMTTEDHTFAINASNTGLTCTYRQWEEYWEVTVSIPHDMDTTNLKRDINLTVSGGGLKSAIQGKIAIAYIERGMDGSNGPLLYPAGNWDDETEYKRTYEDEELMTTPFVYHTLPSGNGGRYFVLEADYSKGNNPYDEEIDPITKKLIWRPFQKMQYVFTEALMAKWARLAKAVFWGDYMFSSTAANDKGEKVDYSAYAESMFTNGKLNGSVVPHLFLDLESGEAKFGKLSESLIHIDHTTAHFDVVLNEGHNVSCATYNEADENYADDAITVITIPKVAEADTTVVDGTHSTVIHEYSAAFAHQPRSTELISQCVCVCSDKALFDSNPNYTEILGMGKTEDDIEAPWNGWFIWNGYRTKFIFLTPSSILKLRSCKSGENGIVWFVENSSDFEILNATMHLEYYQGDEKLYTSIISESSISLAGSYRNPVIIGSKAFNQNAAHNNNGKVEWVWSPERYEDGGRIIYKNNNNV